MKVSICITTYNHESYIAKAIDSVLMQETDFDYEILIGEDDSRDSTRKIVKEYQRKYPNTIRLFLNSRENVIYVEGFPTGRWNYLNNLKNAKGEYIALLDGDDYWTDSHKLQKQIDFLEAHREYILCFHNALITYEDRPQKIDTYNKETKKTTWTIEDIINRVGVVHSGSAVFRNNTIQEFAPSIRHKSISGDYPLFVTLSSYGKVIYLPEKMSVYRKNSGSVTHQSAHNYLDVFYNRILTLRCLNKELKYKYTQLIDTAIRKYYLYILIMQYFYGKKKKTQRGLKKCFLFFKNYSLWQKAIIVIIKLTIPLLPVLKHGFKSLRKLKIFPGRLNYEPPKQK